MMDWRLSIRPASFRGVPFGVVSGELEAGRRTVLHEFPQRDMPYAEDMGAAPHKFTLEAFVLGADYLSRRDKLEKALQNPDPGTLVHPWHGEIEVAQFAPYKVKHTAQDGGMCVFTLSFVRTEKPKSPAASVNPGLRALLAAQEAFGLAAQALDGAISLVQQTAYVIDSSVAIFKRAASLARGIVGVSFSGIDEILDKISGNPESVLPGEALAAAFSGIAQDKATGSAALAWAKAACADYQIPDPVHAGYARQTIRKNGLAFAAFIRRASVIEACKAATGAIPASRDSAEALKNAIVDGFDAAMNLKLPVYPAETVENPAMPADALAPELAISLANALADTRECALAAIAAASRRAPEIESVTPAKIMPCLALAYRYGGKASLADDLVCRNSIVHPGFAPAAPLEVARQ